MARRGERRAKGRREQQRGRVGNWGGGVDPQSRGLRVQQDRYALESDALVVRIANERTGSASGGCHSSQSLAGESARPDASIRLVLERKAHNQAKHSMISAGSAESRSRRCVNKDTTAPYTSK